MQNHAVDLRPIADADLKSVGEFLHDHMNGRIPAATWTAAATPPWSVEAPNHGFMLVADDAIVGVHLAFYSERQVDGRTDRFCNLAAWCVLPEYRAQSLRLLKALLAQDGYHFTDLSPSGNVVPLNTRLKFQRLDTATALVANLPWPLPSKGTRIVTDPKAIERLLKGRDLAIYRDHAGAAAAHHLVIVRGAESCYVIFRRDRRKNIPLFASLLHVGNPDLFRRTARHFFRHLLLRHRIAATLAEMRVVRHRPPSSIMLGSPRPKMYRGNLKPEQVDYLYSELTCVAW